MLASGPWLPPDDAHSASCGAGRASSGPPRDFGRAGSCPTSVLGSSVVVTAAAPFTAAAADEQLACPPAPPRDVRPGRVPAGVPAFCKRSVSPPSPPPRSCRSRPPPLSLSLSLSFSLCYPSPSALTALLAPRSAARCRHRDPHQHFNLFPRKTEAGPHEARAAKVGRGFMLAKRGGAGTHAPRPQGAAGAQLHDNGKRGGGRHAKNG